MRQRTRHRLLWLLIVAAVLPMLALAAAEACHASSELSHHNGCTCACACHLPSICTYHIYIPLLHHESSITIARCQLPQQFFEYCIFRPPQA